MRILVVEDNPALRTLLLSGLSRRRHHAIAAAGVRGLLPLVLRERPDVVLSDIGLPDGDGVSACLRLHRYLPALKVVLMTGDEDSALRARQAGFAQVLLKPFDLGLLEESLSTVKE